MLHRLDDSFYIDLLVYYKFREYGRPRMFVASVAVNVDFSSNVMPTSLPKPPDALTLWSRDTKTMRPRNSCAISL